uniref:Uncharacterized protein n=1 Tax=viral metagenome TaxID=1070528 RepID=A0A6M3KQU6_9ZZZZ
MAWTDYTPVDTVEYKQLEPPPGFGKEMFGHPSEGVNPETGEPWRILSIHERGFGSPTTKWKTQTGNVTVWTDI